jgi:dTMP kinase
VSQRGIYVVIEGIDGTGKTELASRLVPTLLSRGHSISSFHEPADKFLRDEFHRLKSTDSFAAALCLTVDREMLRPQVERALDHGDVVIQDRSFYSTLAYQYAALSADRWRELERIELALALEPDVVLYLDAPIELAIKRVEATGHLDPDEDVPYLERVHRKFEQLFQPPRWVRIDAQGSPERTHMAAMNVLMAAGL